MGLTEFVRNVDDLSDDGGFKFRFHCDHCRDGVESHYRPAATNLLKTGLEIFSMFRPLGGAHAAVAGIDRGLRGKERDKAYQDAVEVAKGHFSKCSGCGAWVCKHCHNDEFALCERCAPNAAEKAAQAAAIKKAAEFVGAVEAGGVTAAPVSCVVCQNPTGGGKFCQHCGTATVSKAKCSSCGAMLNVGAKFCGECGTKAV
jgi:hypothetical protein